MLISEQKPMEEILSYLGGEDKVFIVGCKGCAEGCQTGGEQQAIEMKQKLEEAGKTVTGISLIDFACNEQLTRMTLQAHESKIVDSDSLLMLCCGIGVQAAASVVDKLSTPAAIPFPLEAVMANGGMGNAASSAGSVCWNIPAASAPSHRCAKQLLHGPCGGSVEANVKSRPTCPAPGT